MKKLGAIILSLSLLMALFPQVTMAAQSSDFEQELAEYLHKSSEERGFEVTKEDVEASLAAYDESLSSFNSVKEVSDFLGEVIKADLTNLDELFEEHGLDEESLVQLLQENGEGLIDYVFVDDLYEAVYTYTEDGVFERDPNFEQNLSDYLIEISKIRGFEITKAHIESSLRFYGDDLQSYETVQDLKAFLGDVIKADLSNLDYFKETYELDQPAIISLLEENEKDLDDYVYIDQLEADIWEFSEGLLPGMEEELAEELLPMFEEELGLTEEELKRLEDHFTSLEEYFSDEALLERMEQLGERMERFEEFDSIDEITAEQLSELNSIYDEFLSIFKLKASYRLVLNGTETPLSIAEMLQLEQLKGAKLKVILYNTDGTFLADLLITDELVDSQTVTMAGSQIEKSVEEVVGSAQTAPVINAKEKMIEKRESQQNKAFKTVKGAKLPKTASDYIPNMLLGIFIALAGVLIYRQARNT
ncbi:processed acidic surface protein [Peribacillus saganii]|uniref:Processed acidic surface protein n=1 Tax=Peribacillus saganii TaxID=2303992 RepID=A0A372LU26_9BACI|nr:processed acidic surface protein [Peribacillus saganii]RFU71054.1 processed acidic surface protein [Peribacillus saganii]